MLRAVLLALALMPAAAPAASPAVLLGAGEPPPLQGHVDHLLDPGHELALADIRQPELAARFAPVQSAVPRFGFIPDRIWLRIGLHNAAPAPRAWIVDFNMNFMQGMDVYLVREDGAAETLLNQTRDSPFGTRPISTAELAVRVALEAGERATLYVAYWSGGATGLPLALETEAGFLAGVSADTARVFAFYGIMFLLTAAGLVSALASREMIFVYYAAYAASLGLYLAQMDGTAFRYLWPDAPRFNGFATLPLGAALVIFSALYVRRFLSRYSQPAPLRWAVLALPLAAAVLLLLAPVADTQTLKRYMLLMASGAPLVFVAAGLGAARENAREVRLFLAGWSVAILSGLAMVASHFAGVEISRTMALDSIRVVAVFEALMMGLAILDRLQQLRSASYRSLRAANEMLRSNIALQDRLTGLEGRYEAAKAEAEAGGRRLADAAHDLRQPIHALRMTLQGMIAGGAGAGQRDQVERSFAYLEELVSDYLADATAAPRETAGGHPAQHVLDSLADMFAAEAEEKDIDLRIVRSSAEVAADPLRVMRVLSNLVANAIKYAGGRILVGCRRRGAEISFEVHDEGPGLTAAEFAAASARAVRLDTGGEDPGGHGYGLAIACEVAEESGLRFAHVPRPGGASFRLDAPQAEAIR